MTDKDMTHIISALKTLEAPKPSEALRGRILDGIKNSEDHHQSVVSTPANDNKWKWVGSIAASLIAVSIIGISVWPETFTPSDDTADVWAEAASSIGYDDLYEWVYDTESEESL